MRGTERTRRVPIIFVTAGAHDDQRRFRGFETGAVDFLFKPIEPHVLRSKASVFFELDCHRQENVRLLDEARRAGAALRDLNETLEARVEERTMQVRALATELTLAEQRERRALAQVLHDDLQQTLYGLRFRLRVASATAPDDVADTLRSIDDLVAGAIDTTRRLTADLSPVAVEGGSLEDAFRWLVTYMADRLGLDVALTVEGTPASPNDALRLLLFQAVREALFNAAKYAGTGRSTLALAEHDGTLTVEVADEGVGFDPAAVLDRPPGTAGGFGLRNARERLDLFGAHLDVASAPGAGTRITIRVPVGEDAAPPARDDERQTTDDRE